MSDTVSVELLPEVRAFLDREPIPMFVDGAERLSAGGSALTVTDPSYGRPIAQVAGADEADVDAAVAAARAALEHPDWRDTAPSRVGELLWRLADLVERDGSALAQLDSLCCGLPISDAARQVPAVVEDLRYYAGWTTKLEGRVIPVSTSGYTVYTRREPVGVCAAITSWNFPLEAFSGKVGPALATRNALVLKPAELAPLSALWLTRLTREAGFPAGVVNVVCGGADVGATLVEHPGVDKVAFTGSTAVGRTIAATAARGLKRVSMELGGKSPLVICADADLDRAVRSAAASIFRHSGQNCVAASRLLVHEAVAESVKEGLVGAARSMRQGPALSPDVDLGPVISAARRDAILDHVAAAARAGSRILVGGSAPESAPSSGFYVAPTVVSDVDPDAQLAREEIFGPVVAVFPFSDLDEAIALAERTDYGLSASIWTRDIATARRYVERVHAGTVWVNGHVLYDSAAPFGGVRQSGFGRELGEASLDEYTELKTVWLGD